MEIIGLLFGLAFLFGVALLAGLVLLLALRFLPRRVRFPKRVLVVGAILPALILAYLLVCFGFDVAFGRATMFGDVREDLPNGYVLTSLGKMPEDGFIGREALTGYGCVGEIAVLHSAIAGRYDDSHFPCNQYPKKEKLFFVLDSESGQHREYGSLDAMRKDFGGLPTLVPIDMYRAPLTAWGHVARLMWDLLFLLGPLLATTWFIRFCRRSTLDVA